APMPARLVAIGGLSGTGKSTIAARIAPMIGALPGAVHLRSDVERKRLFGVSEFERLPEAAYAREVTDTVYATLRRKAEIALRAGHGVIIDAVHQQQSERDALRQLARRLKVGFAALWLEAPAGVLTARVSARTADASDAD